MSLIRELLEKAISLESSDVHLKPNQRPFFRVHGALTESGFDTLGIEDLDQIAIDLIPEHLIDAYRNEHEADFSHVEEDVGRFRVNVFKAQGVASVVMRHVKSSIPTYEELHMPPQMKDLSNVQRGIILLSGTTGSGKSSTLAAILGKMNRTQQRRIITIEDPVEYMFIDDQCRISQREVKLDTLDYHAALKHVLRQDPDVIMIGEMRDETSFVAALAAAETGHLVLSTLHSGTAYIAVSRILDLFPSHERDSMRKAIASNLHAIICQRLVPSIDGTVRPAIEIMINTPTVKKLLQKNELDVLSSAIETGREDGMMTFDQSLYDLITNGEITETEAMKASTNPEQLKMNLQGIFLDEGNRILAT